MCKIKEFDIELTSVNDCEFILGVLKNTTIVGELYSVTYDDTDHMKSVLYVNDEQYKTLLTMFPVFEHMDCDEYELEEESYATLIDIKKSIIDDIHSIKTIYSKLEKLHKRYAVNDKKGNI